MPVRKRIVATLPPPVTRPLVPFVDTVHNRAAIEIQRGCTRGCRFCHAGMVYRPVRERPVDEVLDAVDEIVANTGFEEIALLSLSSSDYSQIETLVRELVARHGDRHLSISLPSLRIESVSVDLMEQLQATGRRSSFTFAPEAATERLRGVINKPIADEDLLAVVEEVYSRGWKTVKLYFMIGHPTQTLDDVAAIVDLAEQVRAVGRRVLGPQGPGERQRVDIGAQAPHALPVGAPGRRGRGPRPAGLSEGAPARAGPQAELEQLPGDAAGSGAVPGRPAAGRGHPPCLAVGRPL